MIACRLPGFGGDRAVKVAMPSEVGISTTS